MTWATRPLAARRALGACIALASWPEFSHIVVAPKRPRCAALGAALFLLCPKTELENVTARWQPLAWRWKGRPLAVPPGAALPAGTPCISQTTRTTQGWMVTIRLLVSQAFRNAKARQVYTPAHRPTAASPLHCMAAPRAVDPASHQLPLAPKTTLNPSRTWYQNEACDTGFPTHPPPACETSASERDTRSPQGL